MNNVTEIESSKRSGGVMGVFHEKYHFIAMGLAATSLTPQLIQGWYTGSLRDVTLLTMFMHLLSGLGWAYFMYLEDDIIFMSGGLYFAANAISIMVLQVLLYFGRCKRHMKHFDEKRHPVEYVNVRK